MKTLKATYFLRAPIVWLYLGPPILRDATGRDAFSSLEGNQDIWNLIRVGWFGLWGVVALLELYRLRGHLPGLARVARVPLVAAALLFITALASFAVSPAPAFTIANVTMLIVLAVASLELALKLHLYELSVPIVVKRLLYFNVFLISLILVSLLFKPQLVVHHTSFGARVVGGALVSAASVGIATLLTGLYIATHPQARRKPAYWAIAAVGALVLVATQTRASIAGGLVGAAYIWISVVGTKNLMRRVRVMATSLVVGAMLAGLLLVDLHGGGSFSNSAIQQFIRSPEMFITASGRTAIVPLVVRESWSKPLGLGYAAGARELLLGAKFELGQDRVVAQRIGNAHNMFAEVLAGSGMAGLLAFLVLVAWGFHASRRLKRRERGLLRGLLIALIIEGSFASNVVLPFFQASALLWLVLGLTAGAVSQQHGQVRARNLARRQRRASVSVRAPLNPGEAPARSWIGPSPT